MPPLAARALLGAALLPFLWFALRDQLLHLRVRKVTAGENALHAVMFVLMMIIIGRAFLFQAGVVFAVLPLFLVFGGVDEYVFHRRIPEAEHDMHAKGHFALLCFVAVFGALVWVR
jgi:hypothetical protein